MNATLKHMRQVIQQNKIQRRSLSLTLVLCMLISFLTPLWSAFPVNAAAPTNGAYEIGSEGSSFVTSECYFSVNGQRYNNRYPNEGSFSGDTVNDVEMGYSFTIENAGSKIPDSGPHLYIDASTLKTANGAGFNFLSATDTAMVDMQYSSIEGNEFLDAATFTLDNDGIIKITLKDDYIDYLKFQNKYESDTETDRGLTGKLSIKVNLGRDNTASGDRIIDIGGQQVTVVFDDKDAEVKYKAGTLDKANNRINWTVGIDNSIGINLKDYVLWDSMNIGEPTADPPLTFVYVEGEGYKITSDNATAKQYNITYSTPLTTEIIKQGSVTNRVALKKDGIGKEVSSSPVNIESPFTVVKDGKPDYMTGTYDNKINWEVKITSNYSDIPLEDFTFTDEMVSINWNPVIPNEYKQAFESALASATVSPQGSIQKTSDGKWKFINTGGAKEVTLNYSAPADSGNRYNNRFTLEITPENKITKDKDVEYKNPNTFYNVQKSGQYNQDTKEVTWTVELFAYEGQNLKGYTFKDHMLENRVGNFGGSDTSKFSCAGDTVTVNEETTYLKFTYVTRVDISTLENNSIVQNPYEGSKDGIKKDGEGTATVNIRENLSKSLQGSGYETENTAGKIEKTLSWKVDITADKKLSEKPYIDTLKNAGGSTTHTLDKSSVVVKAKVKAGDSYITLTAPNDYDITDTTDGFNIIFKSTTDEYNYVEITYDTKAVVPQSADYGQYSFSNKGVYGGQNTAPGTYTVNKVDPVINEKMNLNVNKVWDGHTPADKKSKVTFRLKYQISDGSNTSEGYVKVKDNVFLFNGDDGYNSASYYELEVNESTWNGEIKNLPKTISVVDPVTQKQTAVNNYSYWVEEYKIGDNVLTKPGDYLELSDGSIYKSTSDRNYYTGNNDTVNVTNTYYSNINITVNKDWTDIDGTVPNANEVVLRLMQAFADNSYDWQPVKTDGTNYILRTDSAFYSGDYQDVQITLTKGESWTKVIEGLPSHIYVNGQEKVCLYRLEEISVDGVVAKDGRFDEEGTDNYYTVSYDKNEIKDFSDTYKVINQYHKPKNLTIDVEKSWPNDTDDVRPNKIIVQLQKKSTKNDTWVNLGSTVDITAAMGWKYTFDGISPAMPDYEIDENGQKIDYTYRVREVGYQYGDEDEKTFNAETVAFTTKDSETIYEIVYSGDTGVHDKSGKVTITNKLVDYKTKITPKKSWNYPSIAEDPNPVMFKLMYRMEGEGDNAWREYKDASDNSVIVTLGKGETGCTFNKTTNESNGTTSMTIIGAPQELPSRVVTTVDGVNQLKKIQYRFVESVDGGLTYRSVSDKVSYTLNKTDGTGTIDGSIDITSSGDVTNYNETTIESDYTITNVMKENIGINKHIVDAQGGALPGSIKKEDLENLKHTIDGKEYYVFNWYVAFDGKNQTLVAPIRDFLPEGHSLVVKSDAISDNSLLGPWESKYVNHTSPFNYYKNGYYEKPTWVWVYTDGVFKPGDTIGAGTGMIPKAPTSDANTCINLGTEGYYEDKTNPQQHIVYFSKPTFNDNRFMIDVCYSTKILCTDLEEQMGDSKFYTIANRAVKLDSKGEDTDKTDSASVTIVDEKPLIKKGYQKLRFPGYIRYTLNVNPEAKNLSTGDTIDITDIFTTSKYFDQHGPQNYYPQNAAEAEEREEYFKHLVDILLDNVTLYEIVDGEEVKMTSDKYQYQFESNKGLEEGAALLKLVIPDEKSIKIVYDYKIIANENTPSVIKKCPSGQWDGITSIPMKPGMVPPKGDAITFSNRAQLKTESVNEWASRDNDEYIVPESTGILDTTTLPKIVKVDVGNETINSLNNKFYLVRNVSDGIRYAVPISGTVAESDKITKSLAWGSTVSAGTVDPKAKVLSLAEVDSTYKAAVKKNFECEIVDLDANLNAKFLLAKYDTDGWHYATEVKNNEVIKWGETPFSGNEVDPEAKTLDLSGAKTYSTSLGEGTLCKLVEVSVPVGYEGSNLGLTDDQFRELIINYIVDGTTEYNSVDYSVFLKKFKAVNYFAFNRKPTSYPEDIDPEVRDEFERNKNIVSSGGNIKVKNSQLIDIDVTKNWIQPTDAATEVTVKLLWSYTKNTYQIPDDAVDADAETLGIMTEFNCVKTVPEGKTEGVWRDLPNGIKDRPIYYYVKEIAYKIGSTTYELQEDGSFASTSGETSDYRPTYMNNAANSDQEIVVNNSKALLLKKKWIKSNGEVMENPPVSSIKVSIYGINSDNTEDLLFSEIDLAGNKNWTADITNKINGKDLSTYKRLEARESSNGSVLTNYVVSCVFNNSGNTGEIEVQNKSIVPNDSSLKIQKVWNDGADKHVGDEKIGVKIFRSTAVLTADEISNLNEIKLKMKDLSATDITANLAGEGETYYWITAENDWKASFEGLELEDPMGNRYYYYVIEEQTQNVSNADKYGATYTSDTKTLGSTKYVITNARNMLTIQKKWYDDNGKEITNKVDKDGNVVEDVLSELPDVIVKVSKTPKYNFNVEKSYSDIAKERDYVYLVDTCSAVTPDFLREDGCHPNEQGFNAIANAYYNAIKANYTGEKTNIKIVALGDSITNGYFYNGGTGAISQESQTYPYKLTNLLKNDGFTFINNGKVINAGVSGREINEFSSNDNSGYGSYNDIDASTQIICLLGGTNDIHQGDGVKGDLNSISTRMQTLLDALHQKSPDAKIFLGTMPHFNFIKSDGTSITEGGSWWYNRYDYGSDKDLKTLQDLAEYNNAQIDAVNYGVAPETPPMYVTLNAENNWTDKVDIPPGDTDKYYISEEDVPEGWRVDYLNNGQVGGSNIVMIAKNIKEMEYTTISVEKTWVGDITGNSERNKISIGLLRTTIENPEASDWEHLRIDMPTPTGTDGNVWTFTYTNLPKTDIYGNEYRYKVEEEKLDGYATSYGTSTDNEQNGITEGTLHITNIGRLLLKVNKQWSDGADNHKTDEVKIKIYRTTEDNKNNVPGANLILKVSKNSVSVGEDKVDEITANVEVELDLSAEAGYNESVADVSLGADGKTITITGKKLAAGKGTDTTTFKVVNKNDPTDVQVITVTVSAFEILIKDAGGNEVNSFTAGDTVNLSAALGGTAYDGASFTVTGPAQLSGNTLKFTNSGEVTITATAPGGLTATKTITVEFPASFTVTAEENDNKVTLNNQLHLKVEPNYGTFTYESDDSTIASVDSTSGVVSGLAVGEATITVTRSDGIKAYFNVTVEEVKELIVYMNGTALADNDRIALPIGVPVEFTTSIPFTSLSRSDNVGWHVTINVTSDKSFTATANGYGLDAGWGSKLKVDAGDTTKEYVWYEVAAPAPAPPRQVSPRPQVQSISETVTRTSTAPTSKARTALRIGDIKRAVEAVNNSGETETIISVFETISENKTFTMLPAILYAADPIPPDEPDPDHYYKTITLNAGNNWEDEFEAECQSNDGKTYIYWAVEESMSGYEATYFFDDADSTGSNYINAAAPGASTITVRNHKVESTGVELPESGGTGTKPYTAAGIAIMLLSGTTTLYFKRRSRRERKHA